MRKYVIFFICILLIVIFNLYQQRKIPEYAIDDNLTATIEDETVEEKIVFYIKGAIKNPGVYELPYGSYLQQAIDVAGGFVDANVDCLNLAQIIIPYQEIFVPYNNQECETITTNSNEGYININTASLEELTSLDGIGEKKAEAIIDYRSKNPFRAPEEITNVTGISENLYEKIKDKITV